MAPLNENSSALFSLGASLVTSVLPEEHKQDMANIGTTVATMLQNRFFAQQAEDFKNNELAAFMQATSQFGSSYSTIEDPDKAVQALMDFKNSTMLPFLTSTSLKYGKNESIMSVAKSVFEFGPKLSDYIGVQGVKNDQAQIRIGEANAKAAQTQADASMLQAQNQKAKLAQEAPIVGLSPAEQLARIRAMPADERGDKEVFRGVVNRIIQQRTPGWNVARGAQYGTPAGEDQPTDFDTVAAEVDGWPQAKKDALFESAAIRRFAGPDALGKFGGMFDSVAEFNDEDAHPQDLKPMRGAVATPDVIAMVMGSPVQELAGLKNFLADTKTFNANYITTLTSPSQLGAQFEAVMSSGLRRDEHNVLIDSKGKPIEFSPTDWEANQKKLMKIYEERYKELVTDKLVEKNDISKPTRDKVNSIGAAGIAHFLNSAAYQYRIPIRPPLDETTVDVAGPTGFFPSLWHRTKTGILGEE